MNPQQGQSLNAKWGDPNEVQKFRQAALEKGFGVKPVDDYIAQMQSAYQQQAGHQVQNVIGQNQGGITPDQAKQDPTAALSFLGAGGQLTNTGPDAQAKFISDAQKTLSQARGKNKYVDPNAYNTLKEQFAATGGDAATFDAKFAPNYTDPNNMNYNTNQGLAARQAYTVTKKGFQTTLDQYNSIPEDQKGLLKPLAELSRIPVLGALLAPHATEYENAKKGLAATLASTVGGGEGSGLRISQTELDNWSNLLPSPHKTSTQNNIDIKQLNKRLEAKFGPGAGLDSHYLPSKGRASLSSFNQ